MAEAIFRAQLPFEKLKEVPTPKPLNNMEASNNAMAKGEFEYVFESPENGDFVQISFDISQHKENNTVFMFIKFVGTNNEIIKIYSEPYEKIQKDFPMDMMTFRSLDKKITSKVVFKERDERLVEFFRKKKKGAYIGNFVDRKKDS